jgi:hypothetical protein
VSSEGAFLLDWIRDLRPRFPRRRLPTLPAPRWLLWLVAHLTNLYPWDLVASTYGTVCVGGGEQVCVCARLWCGTFHTNAVCVSRCQTGALLGFVCCPGPCVGKAAASAGGAIVQLR